MPGSDTQPPPQDGAMAMSTPMVMPMPMPTLALGAHNGNVNISTKASILANKQKAAYNRAALF
jgi:hypothetical protein